MKPFLCTSLGITLIVLIAASSIRSVADDNQYKWKNSDGDTIFSDKPPTSGESYEVISNSVPSTKPSASDAENDVSQEAESSESNAETNKSNVKACRNAKARLRLLESPDKVSVRNDEGELQELSPQERAIAQRTAKANIDVYCK